MAGGAEAYADLSPRGDRIDLHFRYSPAAVAYARSVPGARFVPRGSEGGPCWRYPLSMESGRRLREAFGLGMEIGEKLRMWGVEARQREANLGAISSADSAELVRLPVDNEGLMEFVASRPYQTADIAMMAATNVLNANQPGTGKTVEVIGAWYEAGLAEGRHLVIAPKTSLEVVWRAEIERFMGGVQVFTHSGSKKADRAAWEAALAAGGPVVLVTNPDSVRGARAPGGGPLDIGEIKWSSITVDEFHKMGLANPKTVFNAALRSLRLVPGGRKYALSGTPIGGQPIRLWGVLNWLEPNEYTSKWAWAETWLEISDNGFGKDIGGIVRGREDDFYRAHARHMVRRLKRAALPGLPPKQRIEVRCPMTPKQAKAYEQFRKDAEIRLANAAGDGDGERIAADNVLTEFARLKQFANALCVVEDGLVMPTTDSGKLEQLLAHLDENGVRKDDPVPGARAIVASESRRFIEVVCGWLREQGLFCDLITGDVSDEDRAAAVREFEAGGRVPRVLCVTTTAGGVSLNLESAGSIHILDETWNPDDQEQLEDRGDRGSRESALVCYYYRSIGTIQQYIAEIGEGKRLTNREVLDLRRRILA